MCHHVASLGILGTCQVLHETFVKLVRLVTMLCQENPPHIPTTIFSHTPAHSGSLNTRSIFSPLSPLRLNPSNHAFTLFAPEPRRDGEIRVAVDALAVGVQIPLWSIPLNV